MKRILMILFVVTTLLTVVGCLEKGSHIESLSEKNIYTKIANHKTTYSSIKLEASKEIIDCYNLGMGLWSENKVPYRIMNINSGEVTIGENNGLMTKCALISSDEDFTDFFNVNNTQVYQSLLIKNQKEDDVINIAVLLYNSAYNVIAKEYAMVDYVKENYSEEIFGNSYLNGVSAGRFVFYLYSLKLKEDSKLSFADAKKQLITVLGKIYDEKGNFDKMDYIQFLDSNFYSIGLSVKDNLKTLKSDEIKFPTSNYDYLVLKNKIIEAGKMENYKENVILQEFYKEFSIQ